MAKIKLQLSRYTSNITDKNDQNIRLMGESFNENLRLSQNKKSMNASQNVNIISLHDVQNEKMNEQSRDLIKI